MLVDRDYASLFFVLGINKASPLVLPKNVVQRNAPLLPVPRVEDERLGIEDEHPPISGMVLRVYLRIFGAVRLLAHVERFRQESPNPTLEVECSP